MKFECEWNFQWRNDTALSLAELWGKDEIVSLLETAGPRLNLEDSYKYQNQIENRKLKTK